MPSRTMVESFNISRLKKNLKREKELFENEEPLPPELHSYMWFYHRVPFWYQRGVPTDDFQLYRYEGKNYNRRVRSDYGNIYHDTYYSIILANRDKYPLACCGFNWDMDSPELEIVQLQSQRDMRYLLELFRWERMLLAVTVDWSNIMGFESVTVLPSSRSGYAKVSKTDVGKMRYDVTPKREGFKYDKERKLWVRKLR